MHHPLRESGAERRRSQADDGSPCRFGRNLREHGHHRFKRLKPKQVITPLLDLPVYRWMESPVRPFHVHRRV